MFWIMKIVFSIAFVALTREAAAEATEFHGGYTSKITKYTPIPALNPKSPVIVKQTRVGIPKNLAKSAYVGYKIDNFDVQDGPVYREVYYMHKTEIRIPKERAIRVKFTKEAMLDPLGRVCLNSSKSYPLRHDLNQKVKFILSSVRYEKLNGGKKRIIPGDNMTVDIEKTSLGQSVEVSSTVGYDDNIHVLSCSQILRVMNGTVVRMYATNPDANESLNEINTIVYFTALGIFGLASICLGIYVFCIKYYEETDD